MIARNVLTVLATVFLVAALWRLFADGFKLGPASRTWLFIASAFAAVSAWLWSGRS